MTSNPKQNRVIWALDAFTQDMPLHQKTVAVLKAWTKGKSLLIEPVYVMSPDQLGIPTEAFSHLANQGEAEAKKRLRELLKKSGLPNLCEPTFLVSQNFSLQKAVETLLDHARMGGASFIVASTQSKKGVSRFLFGSFAESLVLQSEIPVFLVNPKTAPTGLSQVLFSTDLSDKSRIAFEALVKEAAERKFKITIYNRVEYFAPQTVAPIVSSDLYQVILDQDLLKRKAQVNDLVEWAKAQGVAAKAWVDDRSKETNVAAAILKAAQQSKADTIAMASQSGRVASALLGSITRQVVRGAKLPVWVIHPSKKNNLTLIEKKGSVAI